MEVRPLDYIAGREGGGWRVEGGGRRWLSDLLCGGGGFIMLVKLTYEGRKSVWSEFYIFYQRAEYRTDLILPYSETRVNLTYRAVVVS